ncbi:MAG: hypothetical protein ABI608_08940 [Rhizomicrobium sp.]
MPAIVRIGGAWHLNLGPMLTRDGRGGIVAGAILDGPQAWPIRPVAEIHYENAFGGEEIIAGLVGVIIPVRDGLAFDIGLLPAKAGGPTSSCGQALSSI